MGSDTAPFSVSAGSPPRSRGLTDSSTLPVSPQPTPYYQDDAVVIYHGDALELLPELRGSSVDLVVTDPPYVIGAVSAGNMGSKAGGWGDMMNSARWFRDWYAMTRRVLKPTGALWTFCNWRSVPVVMRAAFDAEWSVASLLVWHKDWIGPGGSVGLRPSYEMVALLAGPEFSIEDRGIPDVWTHKWASFKPTGHPAEKPVELLSRLISESIRYPKAKADWRAHSDSTVVLDPFMGSGSTLVAAKARHYRAIGIEAEERWCEVAANRCRQEVLGLVG